MIIRHVLIAILLAFAAPLQAQGTAKPLFSSYDTIALTLQGPLQSLIHNREFQGAVPATLTDPAGNRIPVSVRLRGITRRTAEVCDFPPLRIDLVSPPPANSIFTGLRRLKLVTHCKSSAGFQQKVLLEYAAYRMYAVLTERSMRARLANIAYNDEGGRPIVQRVGFFIEDESDVAARNGMQVVHMGERMPIAYLSARDAARYALFQHLISNHDWSMRAGPAGEECCHNARLIGMAAPGQVVPVPYDFDFSGLVNAPYATAPDALDITDVRQRFYRGYCGHNSEALAVAREMTQRQGLMFAALASIPGLEPKTIANAESYLGRVFADIASDDGTSRKVLKTCLG